MILNQIRKKIQSSQESPAAIGFNSVRANEWWTSFASELNVTKAISVQQGDVVDLISPANNNNLSGLHAVTWQDSGIPAAAALAGRWLKKGVY